MKIFIVVLFAFLFTAQGVPSKEATHGSPTYSMKNDISEDRFVKEIPDDSFGTYGEFGADPKIEAVGYDHEHTYEDFSADVGRYPEYDQFRSFKGFEDVIPREVRVSGLSVEDEDISQYANKKHSDTTEDKQSTSRNLRHAEQDSENLSASDRLGGELDMPGEEADDVTVKGLSDYSYLVGDRLHGLNEMRAAGAIDGAGKVMFDAENSEEFQDFDYDVERDEDLSYDEFLENEGREVQDYEYDNEYDHADEVTIRGQAVEDEDDEELEDDDFEEDDEIGDLERFEDDDYDDDGDDYDEDEDEDDEVDTSVRIRDADNDDEYDEDELDEDDEKYFAVRDKKEKTEAKVKGMSVGFVEDDEDDEYEDDVPQTGRRDDDDEEDDEYEDEYVRELDDDEEEDDEDWDEEDDELDSTSRDIELDEEIPEVDENEASENLHGDEIKPDIKTNKRK